MIDLLDRVPPQNLDAEASVLGAILVDREAGLIAIEKRLAPAAFYHGGHRAIFGAMLRLVEAGAPVDATSVATDLEARGELDVAGGRPSLLALIDHVPSAAGIGYYVDLVQSKARLRELAAIGSEIVKDAYDASEPPDAIADRAEARLVEVLAERSGTVGSFGDAIVEVVNRLDAPPAAPGLSTGFRTLDDTIGGLAPGRMIVVGARPGSGKTSLVCQLARHVATEERRALLFTLEQGRDEIAQQMISQAASVSTLRIASAGLGVGDRERVERAARDLHALHARGLLEVEDTPSLTLGRLRARARLAKLRGGLDLVALDYLQLLDAQPVRGEIREQAVARMSRGLKLLARELGVPIVVAAQLNRGSEQRDGNRPRLSDLRESGAVEQDADVVLLLHRPELTAPDKIDLRGKAEVIVAKNRRGPLRILDFDFAQAFVRFMEPLPRIGGAAAGADEVDRTGTDA